MNGFHLERWYEKSEKTDASVSSDQQEEKLGLSSASSEFDCEDGVSPLTNSPPSLTSITNGSDSEDDVPPLPPPLPSLEELRRSYKSFPMFCSTPNRDVSIKITQNMEYRNTVCSLWSHSQALPTDISCTYAHDLGEAWEQGYVHDA